MMKFKTNVIMLYPPFELDLEIIRNKSERKMTYDFYTSKLPFLFITRKLRIAIHRI